MTSADYTAKTFVMTPKPGTDWKPGDAMVLAQTGNFTDPERQTYILIDTVNGNNCITFFDHANTWDVEPAQEMSWIGKKKGRTVHGIPADNYSAVFRHVIMSGKIFQVDDITGEAFRVPLFKGTWKKGEKYAYYDEVTHNGSSWICVNEKGTSTEPADGNADWLKYAAKGESGKGIKSTDVEYAISVSNVIAPVDGWQTTSLNGKPASISGRGRRLSILMAKSSTLKRLVSVVGREPTARASSPLPKNTTFPLHRPPQPEASGRQTLRRGKTAGISGPGQG